MEHEQLFRRLNSSNSAPELVDPDGHRFLLQPGGPGRLSRVSLHVQSLPKALLFWQQLLGMQVLEEGPNRCLLSFGPDQASREQRPKWC